MDYNDLLRKLGISNPPVSQGQQVDLSKLPEANSLTDINQYLNPPNQGNGPLALQSPPPVPPMDYANKDEGDTARFLSKIQQKPSDHLPLEDNSDDVETNPVEKEAAPLKSPAAAAKKPMAAKPKESDDESSDDNSTDEDLSDNEAEPSAKIKTKGIPTEFSGEGLRQLQKEASQARQGKELLKGATLLSGGMLGANVDTTNKLLKEQEGPTEAEHALNDYMQRVQSEKLDPNSQYSVGLKQFFKDKFDIDIPEGAAGSEVEKSYLGPAVKMYDAKLAADAKLQAMQQRGEDQKFIAEQNRLGRQSNLQASREAHQSTMEQNQDFKKQQDDAHRIDKLSKDLQAEQASGRSAFGIAAKNKQAVENVESLFQGRDPNDLDPREVYETARVLDRVLSQGSPTVSGGEKLTPQTAQNWLAKKMEFVTNERQGANAGSFIQGMQRTFGREKEMADKQINKTVSDRMSAYRDLKDDPRFQDVMLQHGVDPEQLAFNKRDHSKSPQSQSPVSHPEDSEALKWAIDHSNSQDPDEKQKALMIMQTLQSQMNR